MPGIVDAHAHLQHEVFAHDLDAVLNHARAAGIARIMVPGWDRASSEAALALATAHPDLLDAAVGIHPHYVAAATSEDWEALERLAVEPAARAVGEIGLDFFRNLSPQAAQLAALRAQLAFARELGKPILVHCRDAHPELLAVFEADGVPAAGGIMHCFAADVDVARRSIALGLLVSIAGPVTYPNARRLGEVVRAVPLDRLVVETDCPYLPPQPWRGQRNEPAYLRATAARVAELREVGLGVLAARTTRTACLMLGLDAPDAGS